MSALSATLAATTLLVATPEAVSAQPESQQVCNTDVVNVRSGPGKTYDLVGKVEAGTVVIGARFKATGWFAVSAGEFAGQFISANYLCSNGEAARKSIASAAASAELRAALSIGPAAEEVPAPRVAKAIKAVAPAAPVSKYKMIQPAGTEGSPTVKFGWRIHPVTGGHQHHQGIDLGNRSGEPIVAAADGVVEIAQWGGASGRWVKIEHAQFGQVESLYLHMSKMNVKVGQKVKAGDIIGWVGNTGRSTVAHLHFEIHVDGKAVDPQAWIGPLASLKK